MVENNLRESWHPSKQMPSWRAKLSRAKFSPLQRNSVVAAGKSDSNDRFAKVREATLAHRAKHGCTAWPYDNGPLLGVLAGAAGATRILELGCALGYTSLSFAHGAPKAKIDTVERDPEHIKLARANFAAAGVDKRVTVHQGEFLAVVKTLKGPYDLAFFDGGAPVPRVHEIMRRLLRPSGVLITANLNHGGTADDVLAALLDPKKWLTSFLDEERETGISIKL
jgi:predicted O-methyltransferase YrrM